MYFVESFIRLLKSFVRNKARPEGSIAEAYIVQESVAFCSRYLDGVETRLNRAGRNYEGVTNAAACKFSIFTWPGKQLRGKKYEELSLIEWEQANNYVLKNCEDRSEYMSMHKDELTKTSRFRIEERHKKEFSPWFKGHVFQQKDEREELNNDLIALACGPYRRVWHHTSYLVNGWRFCTREHDTKLMTENSGVLVKGDESTSSIDYFGTLTYIIRLEYPGGYSIVLFKRDWRDVYHKGRGYKEDKYRFILVNTSHHLSTNEQYALVSQAEQVYYVRDTEDPNWQVVVKTKPRDLYDIPYEESKTRLCQENEDIRPTSFEHIVLPDSMVELHTSNFHTDIVQKPPITQEYMVDADTCFTDEEDDLLFENSDDDDDDDEFINSSTNDDLDDDL